MNPIIAAVAAQLEAQRAEALAKCQVYMNNPLAIADHNSFTSEAVDALKELAEANGALTALERLLPKEELPQTPVAPTESTL